MNVRLVTHHAVLAESVAKSLRGGGHEVDVRPDTVFDSELRYGPSTSLSDVTGLVEQLKPLLPTVQPDATLEGSDVELRLGESKPFANWEVKVYVESEGLGDRLRSRLLALGFRDDGLSIDEPDRNMIKYGGATPFARQVVRWLLAEEGIQATETKDWGDDDDDIWVYARDPAFEGKSVRERYPIEIHGDDYERMFLLKERLEGAGFSQVSVRSLDTTDRPKFSLAKGPMDKDPEAALELAQIFQQFLEDQAVDAERYPMAESGDADGKGHARIELPLAAMDGSPLRPYAGAFPERWEVVFKTDDAAAVQPLKARLADHGYADIKVEPLPSTAFGFGLRWGGAREHDEVAGLIRGMMEEAIDEAGLSGDYPLAVSDTLSMDDPRIVLELPLAAAGRSTYEDRLKEAAAGWELSLKAARPDDHESLIAALGSLPWKTWARETETDATPEIQYGGAPVQLVEYVRDVVERHAGVRLPITKDWGDGDDDIWIHLPSSAQPVQQEEDAPLDLASWLAFGIDEPAEARPLVDVRADRVRIGPVTLRRQPVTEPNLVPRPSQFAHYCLDQRTAETLIHVAESVMLREPCLLEGETSVSKTSIVQYLAMLLGQPIVRLNLNGQTDTGELVGRYVPQDMAASLPLDPGELLAAAELLESESRMILERAQEAGRTLTRVEIQQIMANERMHVHPWRWQDGLVVTAMRRGWWIVLDELNLAEPQILERLNPVLERNPTLVLTEHDNTVIGSTDEPVHPAFRVFATMNPAEYAGRSALSPAYRDRWRAYRYVQPPGEAEYLDMLRYLVFGEQPKVETVGGRFAGGRQEAPMGMLADVEGIDDFLRALARFHAALEEAVGRSNQGRATTLGGRRRERYVFTRRGLLAVMDYLGSALATDGGGVRSMRQALARYYLGRVMPGGDQRIVARLLDAAGIGPATWSPERLDRLNAGPTDTDDDDWDGEE